MKFRILTAVFICMITVFSVTVAAKVADITNAYQPGITAGEGGGICHNTTAEISNKYSNTVSLNYGRICFQPIRKVFTGDIEQWSFITLNKPPVYGKRIRKNVKAFLPAMYKEGSLQFSDGVNICFFD